MALSLRMLALAGTLSVFNPLFSQNVYPVAGGLMHLGEVYAVDYDSQSDRILVGGRFSQIGGVKAENIALFENNAWTPLGPGTDNTVYAVKCVQNEVYAAGYFPHAGGNYAGRIARWDGQEWQPMGSGLNTGANVKSIEWFDDKLWIAGLIKTAGGQAVRNLAVWDGVGWQDGDFPAGFVPNGLKACGDTLYVWGTGQDSKPALAFFTNNDWDFFPQFPSLVKEILGIDVRQQQITVLANRSIHRLDGNAWTSVYTTSSTLGKLESLCRVQDALYFRERSSGFPPDDVKKMDAAGDVTTIGTSKNAVFVLHEVDASLWVGGDFLQIGSLKQAACLARYDGSAWNAPAFVGGPYGSPSSLLGYCLFQEPNGDILAGGDFLFVNTTYSPCVARWDGANWHSMGSGLDNRVRKILRFQGQLIAVGSFTHSGEQDCKYIARWNGTDWEQFGPAGLNGIVRDAAEWNGKLYVAGEFKLPGNQQGIACFDGMNWTAVGPDLYDYQVVYTFGNFNGQLLAGVSNYGVLQFDPGMDWVNLGGPPEPYDLTVYDGALYVAALDDGAFRYNGGPVWENMNAPITGHGQAIWRLFTIGGDLYLSSNNAGLYRLDGSAWTFFDNWPVVDLLKISDERYFMAGFFSYHHRDGQHEPLRGIAEMVFEPPVAVLVENSPDTICPNMYTFLRAGSQAVNSSRLLWELPGSVEDTLYSALAISQYPEPGIFPRTLHIRNYAGSDTLLLTPLTVSDACPVSPEPKLDNIWVMRYNYNEDYTPVLDFRYGEPAPGGTYIPEEMAPSYANASICDDAGKLVLYTNGRYILNGKLQPVPGSDTSGNYFTYNLQGALILPFPGHSGLYYLFYVQPEEIDMDPDTGVSYQRQPLRLAYHLLDVNANNGLGGIVAENQTAIADTLLNGSLHAVRHANGKDWWIVSPEFNSDRIYLALLTENGISAVTNQAAGFYLFNGHDGQTAFSPDGAWLGMANATTNRAYLWRFDRCTGLLVPVAEIPFGSPAGSTSASQNTVHGCSFSPDGRRFYINNRFLLYQFDLQSLDIESTRELVAELDGEIPYPPIFNRQQEARNGRIYLSNLTGGYVHEIRHPNEPAPACGFRLNEVLAGDNYGNLPNYPNFSLGAIPGQDCLVSNPEQLSQPIVFPNPASGGWSVQFKPNAFIDEVYTVQLFDARGQLLRTETRKFFFPQSFETGNLPKGVYFQQLQSSNHRFMVKIVIGR